MIKSSDRLFFLFLLFVGFFSWAGKAFAFSEMIRHNYNQCTTCHISPFGGGVPTAYGRKLSEEVLSTWSKEGEGNFAYGALTLPEWLALGGDGRVVQTYLNSPFYEQGRFIFMQADVEGAATVDKFIVDATLGYQSDDSYNHSGGWLISRRHYINYRPNDQISLRAGKFQTAFGINMPDHYMVTKRNLRWDEGSETYNLEAAWLGEKFDTFVTADFGRPDDSDLNFEKGLALRSSVVLGEHYRIGASYFYGWNDTGSRHVVGPFGILGITPHFFILSELDFQQLRPNNLDSSWGLVNYLKVDYEVIQGLHFYGVMENSIGNFSLAEGRLLTYGLGTQFFPRPHFEFNLFLQKRKLYSTTSTTTDFVWLMGHFYL